jgi:hypothetical protein
MRAVVSFLPIAIIALLLGVYLNQSLPSSSSTHLLSNLYPPPVVLQNFSICPTNCLYPSPFIEGEVVIHYSSDMHSMQFLVNGMGDPPRNFTGTPNPTNYIYIFKAESPIPIQAGQTYTLTFVIVFDDGLTDSTRINVIAE